MRFQALSDCYFVPNTVTGNTAMSSLCSIPSESNPFEVISLLVLCYPKLEIFLFKFGIRSAVRMEIPKAVSCGALADQLLNTMFSFLTCHCNRGVVFSTRN